MINITKTQPAPPCLEIEKKKKSGNYRCGTVLPRLKADFHNKCYICENAGITNINVEHFRPHQDDIDLKFDWNNLFYACGHCNNTKSNKYQNLLDCTNLSQQITDLIQFDIKPFPYEMPKISAIQKGSIAVDETVSLLQAVYNGTTQLKQIESANLRQKLIVEIAAFGELLRQYYFKFGLSDKEKERISSEIRRKLHPAAAFTAFKVWIIKNNKQFKTDFPIQKY